MLLPIRPKPFEDELLSSWLTRLAVSNNCYAHEFYHTILGIHDPIFVRDIDRLIMGDVDSRVSEATGINKAQINQLRLNTFTGIISESFNTAGHSRWVLPLGLYHRRWKLKGIQYCPLCLAEDSHCYFRKNWRLSFITTCPKHLCLLKDCCPACSSPIEYQRISVGRRMYETPSKRIDICSQCQNLLSEVEIDWVKRDIELLAHSYRQFVADFSEGIFSFRNLNETMSVSEFNGIWYMIGSLSVARAKVVRKRIHEATGIKLKESAAGSSFDFWSVQERFNAMVIVLWILEDWPRRFIELSNGTKFSKSVFSDNSKQIPFWLMKIVDKHLNKSGYVITDLEIISACKYLTRHQNRLNFRDLSKLLNLHIGTCRERVAAIKKL